MTALSTCSLHQASPPPTFTAAMQGSLSYSSSDLNNTSRGDWSGGEGSSVAAFPEGQGVLPHIGPGSPGSMYLGIHLCTQMQVGSLKGLILGLSSTAQNSLFCVLGHVTGHARSSLLTSSLLSDYNDSRVRIYHLRTSKGRQGGACL